jgi:hypothetical protein
MLPLLFAYFPMGLNINSRQSCIGLLVFPNRKAPRVVVSKSIGRKNMKLRMLLIKGFTSTEKAVHFFCNVVDNLIACSLSKAKSPNSIMPVDDANRH